VIRASLAAFLVVFSAGLWRLPRKLVGDLASRAEEVTPRALALWAYARALIIVPIGAALGPGREQIQAAILAGP
jgi:hypothetical protein